MDPITKYLNNIAYKFPKGYPDMNDSKDKAMLSEIINNIINKIPGIKASVWRMHNWSGVYDDITWRKNKDIRRSCGRPFSPDIIIFIFSVTLSSCFMAIESSS